jgi:hypothetical protein
MDLQLARVVPARGLLILRALVIAAGLGACSTPIQSEPPPTDPPTAEQAEELFAEVVDRAESGDWTGLCELGGGNCEGVLEDAGMAAPASSPRIAVNETMREARGADESDSSRLLVVCGDADDGTPYVTEIAVIWDTDGDLIAAEPVYWSGLSVSTSGSGEGEPERTTADPPPGC